MSIHDQSCRFALSFAFVLLPLSSLAGEIVLFDGENFQGQSMAFRDTAPNLDATGFNDRTASISVRDGTWEVCYDADFHGACMRLTPGDYPRLDQPFARSISSLRQVGGADYSYAPPAVAAPNGITLFDGEDFQGDRVTFGDVVINLDGTGFNDRTASISVRGGTWEVCFDADFQGSCMQLQPGDYPRLDPPFNRSISSLRPLGGVYGGNYASPAQSEAGLAVGVPGVSIGINVQSYPELVPVPGYPVYYAPQVNSNYFFYDGMYWAYQQDNWYASSWYNGPWAFVASAAVPLFVLRVPVRYYRQPPAYFRGWRSDAPPRWDEKWGNGWAQSHRGWDNWNRNAAPAPAPLPAYQRQYSGNRYPAAAQQRVLQDHNYRYQPQDAVVRQHYQAQQRAASVPRGQPPQSGSQVVRRTATPASPQPSTTPVARGQPSQSGGRGAKEPGTVSTPHGAASVARGPSQSGSRAVQSPQSGATAAQQPAHPAPALTQREAKSEGQYRGIQGNGRDRQPRQDPTNDAERNQQGGERSK